MLMLVADRDTVKFLHPGYLDPRLDDSYGEDLEQRLDFIRRGESPEYDSLVLPDMPSPDIKQQEAFMDIEAQVRIYDTLYVFVSISYQPC